MRRLIAILLPALLLCAPAAGAKQKNLCTSKSGKAFLKAGGKKTLQTLRSGQYYAYRQQGGVWTFCDSKASARSGFKSFGYDGDGQHYTGVRLLSRPGRCVALQLKPRAGGIPAVPTVDMRKGGGTGSSVQQIDFRTPGARIVKVALSSTCLLGVGYTSADGSRHIRLSPVLPPNVLNDQINLSPSSTDADLKALSLSGDDVRWTDAGIKQSKHYAGLP